MSQDDQCEGFGCYWIFTCFELDIWIWQILGPDSGWQPIHLTDIVNTKAVKKAYRKATLFVHPDKLQQRGASIQQKYICEKVFDLLKVRLPSLIVQHEIWILDQSLALFSLRQIFFFYTYIKGENFSPKKRKKQPTKIGPVGKAFVRILLIQLPWRGGPLDLTHLN